MAILIRRGYIHTMTEQGAIQGDVLVSGDRILQVEAHIDPPRATDTTVLDGQGMHILPGLIDACIAACDCDVGYLKEQALSSGVTNALICPEDGGPCSLLRSGIGRRDIVQVFPEKLTDEQLANRIEALALSGNRILCSIHAEGMCRHVMAASARYSRSVILENLSGCGMLMQDIAAAGHDVILGVQNRSEGNPWRMAAELVKLGVRCAISCRHPAAKLKLLPVCAGLCVREGMEQEDALHTITSLPASILGLGTEGCIRPGNRADLAIFDGNPLLLATSHILTIADGRIIHHG